MIAYFDSSSLVKWFFDEPHMEAARAARDGADASFTSIISLPEVLSAFNRAWREKRCSRAQALAVRGELGRVWPALHRIRPDADLADHAGRLVFEHDLRGMDALHLASALLLASEAGDAGVLFSCFDQRLNRAARKEGLLVHPA